MTMPHTYNCSHSGKGWCLSCVKELGDEFTEMLKTIDSLKLEIRRLNYESTVSTVTRSTEIEPQAQAS